MLAAPCSQSESVTTTCTPSEAAICRAAFLKGRVGDDDARPEVLDGGAGFGLGEPGIDRRERGAELRDAVADVERAEIGRAPPHHPIERRDALGRQPMRGLVGAGVELAERSLLVAERRSALRGCDAPRRG